MVKEETLAKVAVLADELEASVQIHLHESREEVLTAVERTGVRPIDLLERLG
jgi:5-methylthioadenosine/S-adenosylhomocysteine deaminase